MSTNEFLLIICVERVSPFLRSRGGENKNLKMHLIQINIKRGFLFYYVLYKIFKSMLRF